MHYVSVEGVGKTFGVKPLFTNISFHIEEGDKIALVARNGSGKSTILKILAGKETAETGKIWINRDVKVVFLEQEPVFDDSKNILDNILYHDHPLINAVRNFEAVATAGTAEEIAAAITSMDELGAWNFEAQVKQILSKLGIDYLHQAAGTLSGGQRKRVALAKTLIDIGFENQHVLLIMDEPTNHIDVDMVEWLEHFLTRDSITLLMVTHDRYFLDAVCSEIWELDNDNLFVYRGDYENFLEKKAARLESKSASVDKARNLFRKELEWMRKQPKARTTKSKSREDAFYEVEKKAHTKLDQQQLELNVKMSRLGGKIAELKKVYKKFGDKVILKGFDYTFKKGERVGVIGKNGVGKSTFLHLLQDLESPDSGKVNIGETVIFGNYAQQGLEVKEDKRIIEFVKDIAENFPLANGSVLSASQFLTLFLFPPDQQYTYVSKLSGGEKRRLHLLSILFRNPNFLILDEPTNDLDLQTLGVLENFLSEYQGCILIVSHDRYFMDRLVDHLFVFEGEGVVRDFPGNYLQYRNWVKEQEKQEEVTEPSAGKKEASTPAAEATGDEKRKKLSYKEKREFGLLEKEIADMEKEKALISEKMNNPSLSFQDLQQLSLRIGEIGTLLEEKEMQWLVYSEYEQ